MSSCPLCDQGHESCVFAAGSLYCVGEGCTNPHHRTPRRDDAESVGKYATVTRRGEPVNFKGRAA